MWPQQSSLNEALVCGANSLIGRRKGQTRCDELKISQGLVFPRLSQPPRCDNYMKGSGVQAHFHPGIYRQHQRVGGEAANTTVNNTHG